MTAQVLAELQESNRHLKDLANRMDHIEKRLQSLEADSDHDADDEGDGHPKQKKSSRRCISTVLSFLGLVSPVNAFLVAAFLHRMGILLHHRPPILTCHTLCIKQNLSECYVECCVWRSE